ncbi:MAG: polysaccharide lyase [Candidatus Rokuibacteriota bacterium]
MISPIASALGKVLSFCGLAGLAFLLPAASPPWTHATEVLRLYDGPDGATCEYFNRAARIRWRTKQGDWIDASGKSQGSTPAARAHVADLDRSRMVAWDVTDLVRAEEARRGSGMAFLIRPVSGTRHGGAAFFSREATDPTVRPQLLLEFIDGGRQSIRPVADTYTDCSTVRSLGTEETLRVSGDQNLLLDFAFAEMERASPVAKATLQLTTARQYGDSDLGVFRLEAPSADVPATPTLGIAAAYPGDVGIEKDAAVVMATNFESTNWLSDWGDSSPGGSFSVVAKDHARRFEPLAGRALRVEIPAGQNLGLDLSYVFGDQIRSEPEEIYFRYYLRFGDDWAPTVDGGKLPGIAGTYGRAGWGGRRSDGTNGWSMRGLFVRAPAEPNPLQHRTTLGTYAYHADMKGGWGEEWTWMRSLHGLVKRNTWYSIEQHFRVNTPDAADGVLRVWIDGVLAFEKKDIRVRKVQALKIDRVWMNVYHGGAVPTPRSLHLYIDNVVIARKYIGPLSGRPR